MELRVDEPDPNDEGELRRMRLLEQADRDAAARLKRKDQVRRLDQNKKAQETSEKAYCLKLRRQLYVLQKQMPVYRDEKGEFRVRWQRDSYQGEREYLDDATRATEIGWIHQELKTKCPNPNDVQKQRAARNRQILSARCEAARAELEVMERPSTRTPRRDIEQKRRQVRALCDKE